MGYTEDLWSAWMDRERARARVLEVREAVTPSVTSGAPLPLEQQRVVEHAIGLRAEAERRFEDLWRMRTGRTEKRLDRHIRKVARRILPRGITDVTDQRLGEMRTGGRRWAIDRFRTHGIAGAPFPDEVSEAAGTARPA